VKQRPPHQGPEETIRTCRALPRHRSALRTIGGVHKKRQTRTTTPRNFLLAAIASKWLLSSGSFSFPFPGKEIFLPWVFVARTMDLRLKMNDGILPSLTSRASSRQRVFCDQRPEPNLRYRRRPPSNNVPATPASAAGLQTAAFHHQPEKWRDWLCGSQVARLRRSAYWIPSIFVQTSAPTSSVPREPPSLPASTLTMAEKTSSGRQPAGAIVTPSARPSPGCLLA